MMKPMWLTEGERDIVIMRLIVLAICVATIVFVGTMFLLA